MASRSSDNDPKPKDTDEPRPFDSSDMEETNRNRPDWWNKDKRPDRARYNVEGDDKDVVDNPSESLNLHLSESENQYQSILGLATNLQDFLDEELELSQSQRSPCPSAASSSTTSRSGSSITCRPITSYFS